MIFVIICTQVPGEIEAWRIFSPSFISSPLTKLAIMCASRSNRWLFQDGDDTYAPHDEILKMKFIETEWNEFGKQKATRKFPLFIFDALCGIVSGIEDVYLVCFEKFFLRLFLSGCCYSFFRQSMCDLRFADAHTHTDRVGAGVRADRKNRNDVWRRANTHQ